MHRFKSVLHYSYHHHALDKTTSTSLLNSRSVIRFSGPDTVKFLQGLLTNDIRRFDETPSEATSFLPTPNLATVSVPPMYAALLTPQGRFLYDLFLYRPTRAGEKLNKSGSGPGSDSNGSVELLADVDTSVLDELLHTFQRYRLRSKVEIENVAGEFSCWQRFGGNLTETSKVADEPEAASVGWGSGVDRAARSSTQGDGHGWQWFKDPRLDCLGFRGIFPSNQTPPLVEADKETNEKNYQLWRIENGVAEGSTEIPKEVEEKVAPGSEVIDTTSSKKVGFVTAALGCRGLGVLRLEEAWKGSGSLIIEGQDDLKVETIRPKWWPAEWFPEHQQHSAVA
eukprot:XP_025014024.1 putative transferase At4g12130, mitochondrial isoform X2 [Ricinus communis]